ncbi:MAG: prolipoprotein diacylglyceryl transferase family protein [Streptosporangiaceae bacterium]|jgi:prolipoprotein diacylglyceryltransferase
MALASIPSPGHAAWRLGPLPLRAYPLCVIAGIIVALVVASRRYRRSGGQAGVILDVAAWAIPFGLAGALAHAILLDTRHDFTHAHRLWHVVTVSVAGIGVPGAVALGAAGAWVACRRAGPVKLPLGPVAGAAAPAVAFGLAIGGLGNWWAQQFYGRPSSWWWAVRISPEHRVPGYENYATFQPAFLYQSLWDVTLGFAVIWAARRFALSGERTFMLCAAGYAAGSLWVESARVGPLPYVLGVRYGALGDIAVFVLAVVGMYLTRPRRRPPARVYPKRALVEDSSGDVMSM